MLRALVDGNRWCLRPRGALLTVLLVCGSRSDAQQERLLAVTDIGQIRLVLSNAGTYGTAFIARDFASMEWPARYLYRLRAGESVVTKRLALLK